MVSTETLETVAIKLDARLDPSTSDVLVRRALAIAVDCEALVRAVMDGLGTCRGVPFHRASKGVGDDFLPFDFEPQEARRLITQANASGKLLTLQVRENTAREPRLWEEVAGFWENAGLEVRVEAVEPRTHFALWEQGGDRPVQAIEFTHRNELLDPSQSLIFLACGFHASFYCNPEVEEVVREADAWSGEKRTRKMKVAIASLRRELPIIWLMSPHTVYGVARDLEWSPRPDGLARIDTMHYRR